MECSLWHRAMLTTARTWPKQGQLASLKLQTQVHALVDLTNPLKYPVVAYDVCFHVYSSSRKCHTSATLCIDDVCNLDTMSTAAPYSGALEAYVRRTERLLQMYLTLVFLCVYVLADFMCVGQVHGQLQQHQQDRVSMVTAALQLWR